jgi:hypothetical protein
MVYFNGSQESTSLLIMEAVPVRVALEQDPGHTPGLDLAEVGVLAVILLRQAVLPARTQPACQVGITWHCKIRHGKEFAPCLHLHVGFRVQGLGFRVAANYILA